MNKIPLEFYSTLNTRIYNSSNYVIGESQTGKTTAMVSLLKKLSRIGIRKILIITGEGGLRDYSTIVPESAIIVIGNHPDRTSDADDDFRNRLKLYINERMKQKELFKKAWVDLKSVYLRRYTNTRSLTDLEASINKLIAHVLEHGTINIDLSQSERKVLRKVTQAYLSLSPGEQHSMSYAFMDMRSILLFDDCMNELWFRDTSKDRLMANIVTTGRHSYLTTFFVVQYAKALPPSTRHTNTTFLFGSGAVSKLFDDQEYRTHVDNLMNYLEMNGINISIRQLKQQLLNATKNYTGFVFSEFTRLRDGKLTWFKVPKSVVESNKANVDIVFDDLSEFAVELFKDVKV